MNKDILEERIRTNVAHREDMIEHYGVKGMKWRDKDEREKQYEVDANGNVVETEQEDEDISGRTGGTYEANGRLNKLRMKLYGVKSKGNYRQDFTTHTRRTQATTYGGERSKIAGTTNSLRYQATRAAADVTSKFDSKRAKILNNLAKKNYIKGKIANASNLHYKATHETVGKTHYGRKMIDTRYGERSLKKGVATYKHKKGRTVYYN